MNIIRNKLPEFNEIVKYRRNNLKGSENKGEEQIAIENGVDFLVWKFIQVYSECVRKGLWFTPEGYWIKEESWEICRLDLTREEFGGGALLNALERKLGFRFVAFDWVEKCEGKSAVRLEKERGAGLEDRGSSELVEAPGGKVEVLDFGLFSWPASMIFGRCRVLKGWCPGDYGRFLRAADGLLKSLRPIGSQVFLS